ncbi:hypothetical protein MGG_17383 [Pyricularia oryzae 70-15]|uniref:Uncharacterized protein n=2 Tax=Pyricularia oryzae TaxID=318829 RepID=G4NEW5_PYRO7|nr:uncharacterized protein MGG_17383 [Pyricularia oryzae 70-15]EHA48691.1 hypothetical protein MGG_17383 [Pyricularia oryzae 70-15]KAI7928916.1 hypothetical protein M9X92_001495 [Pyricularia oryzae]KAI7929646.1 hypothetical protein M0657_002123 [Pyricularia oryzae]QBZ62516.1 hypothetical protein PoMZ_11398 [Pyricularia oryzae]
MFGRKTLSIYDFLHTNYLLYGACQNCVFSMFPQSLAVTEIAIKLLAIYNESLELYHTEHGTRL